MKTDEDRNTAAGAPGNQCLQQSVSMGRRSPTLKTNGNTEGSVFRSSCLTQRFLEFIQIQPLFQIILNNPTQEIKNAWIEIVKKTNTSKLHLSLFTVFCGVCIAPSLIALSCAGSGQLHKL